MISTQKSVYHTRENGVWRSLAARLLWEQEVGGSNPLTPTTLNISDTPNKKGRLIESIKRPFFVTYLTYWNLYATFDFFLLQSPRPTRPEPIKIKLAGSGTGATPSPLPLNAKLIEETSPEGKDQFTVRLE